MIPSSTMEGMAASIGANALAETLRQLETALKEEQPGLAREILPRARNELTAVRQAVARYRAGHIER